MCIRDRYQRRVRGLMVAATHLGLVTEPVEDPLADGPNFVRPAWYGDKHIARFARFSQFHGVLACANSLNTLLQEPFEALQPRKIVAGMSSYTVFGGVGTPAEVVEASKQLAESLFSIVRGSSPAPSGQVLKPGSNWVGEAKYDDESDAYSLRVTVAIDETTGVGRGVHTLFGQEEEVELVVSRRQDATWLKIQDPESEFVGRFTSAGRVQGKTYSIEDGERTEEGLSLIHISEPTRPY
eukprot:TRINITY_DN7045_c0_g1_i1.p1 TRINITY_DN7045_c0_g1~~TRINITY_DN7045_c0_g1_i1.p1  ORF type:complete len:239 (-),score=67.67 TRINITY_DN7045_c0_g1_i1:31-747(-)